MRASLVGPHHGQLYDVLMQAKVRIVLRAAYVLLATLLLLMRPCYRAWQRGCDCMP